MPRPAPVTIATLPSSTPIFRPPSLRLRRLVADQHALAAVEAGAHVLAPAPEAARVLGLVERQQAVEHGAVGLEAGARVEARRRAKRLVAAAAGEAGLPGAVVADPDARAIEPAVAQPDGLPGAAPRVDHDAVVEPAEPHLAVAGALAAVLAQRR